MVNFQYLVKTKIQDFFLIFGIKARFSKINPEEKKALTTGKFLNIGAGKFSHPSWINVDKLSPFYQKYSSSKTVHWDLLELKQLPFPNNSIDLIYSSHVVEHISDKSAMNLFSEAYLKLKKGGIIRIVCPDIIYLFDSYKRNDKDVFSQ
ncbi:MAG: methyltransferase domain-containing protein [Nanoarchaeota archaeon]